MAACGPHSLNACRANAEAGGFAIKAVERVTLSGRGQGEGGRSPQWGSTMGNAHRASRISRTAS
jgi:hypothetical protein